MVAAQDSRVTVITGGGSGMGRATAVRLAQRGDSVCICDLKEDGINESAELIRSAGHTAYTGIVDVRNQAQVQAWIAEVIGKFGKIDCLFSNAGLNARATVADMDYLLPTAMEVPKAQLISTEDFPSPHNPLGVKGAGEGGITAAGAALANAVSNALGVEVKKLPLKPDYILQLMKDREAAG